jgi:hypothetical protein
VIVCALISTAAVVYPQEEVSKKAVLLEDATGWDRTGNHASVWRTLRVGIGQVTMRPSGGHYGMGPDRCVSVWRTLRDGTGPVCVRLAGTTGWDRTGVCPSGGHYGMGPDRCVSVWRTLRDGTGPVCVRLADTTGWDRTGVCLSGGHYVMGPDRCVSSCFAFGLRLGPLFLKA